MTVTVLSYNNTAHTLACCDSLIADVDRWLRACRKVCWFSAKPAASAGASGAAAVLRWPLSADPHGRAVRAGLRNHARRRFGCISNASLRAVRRDAARGACFPTPSWSAGDSAETRPLSSVPH